MIFLLSHSDHNDDIMSDWGYAVNDEEVKDIARRYVMEYFVWWDDPQIQVTVDHHTRLVTAKWCEKSDPDMEDRAIFYLVTVKPCGGKDEENGCEVS